MLRTEIWELIRKSAPIAGILLFWLFFGKLFPLATATRGALVVGVLMAILYVAVKGPELGETLESSVGTDGGILFEANVIVAAAAGSWFLLGSFLWLVVIPFSTFRPSTGPLLVVQPGQDILTEFLPFVFVGTGVLTACLYVVAVGIARYNSRERRADRSSTDSLTE